MPVIPAVTPKRHSWLPVLTVLFLISYGLMTMLIVEQGQTIESQRALIRELFRDSTELSATKIKSHEARAQALAQNPSSQTPSTHAVNPAPSIQAPSTQSPTVRAPSRQAPFTQVAPQERTRNQVKSKSEFHMPSKPASDLSDNRRSVITI